MKIKLLSTLDQNDFIGEIGFWEEEQAPEITIPEDVQDFYGRGIHHLDLCTQIMEEGLSTSYFNPLLFLKKLYAF